MTNLDINGGYVGNTQVEKICLGSEAIWPSTPPIDYSQQYFTIEILSGSNLTVNPGNGSFNPRVDFYYSMNDSNWIHVGALEKQFANLNTGDKIRFKSEEGAAYFVATRSYNDVMFKVYGNMESMEYGDNFTGQTTVKSASAFTDCFSGCTGLVDAENLVLPATTLANYCYDGMFYDCWSLTSAPELPATTLASSCYRGMFQGCTSLTQAPVLPATTLANYCYNQMFRNCTSLTHAPSLSATTLTSSCYRGMFQGCTSLTQAPVLPATTLATGCYGEMFRDCTSLSSITCLAPAVTPTNAVTGWVTKVSNTGTFVKHPNATWSTGNSGIPSGWTVVDADI